LDIGTIVTLIIAGISAVATVVIAFFTYKTIQAYDKQVRIGQGQVKVSQEQVKVAQEQIEASRKQFQQERFTEHRPLLIPEGAPKFQRVKPLFLNRTTNEQRISIHNVGLGVALNVASVLYGEPYNRPYIHWTCWLGVPVAAGMVMKAVHKLGWGLFDEETMRIGSYTLNAPEPERNLTLPNTLAHITITYRDIFRRKHASIFDYVETVGWQFVDFPEDIPQDLYDLQFEASNG